MKKLLTFLACSSFVCFSSASIVSCKKKDKPNNEKPIQEPKQEPIEEINKNHELIKSFQQNVESEFRTHNRDTIESNLYHMSMSFINKANIEKYNNKTFNELKINDFNELYKDLNKILKVEELKKRINEIKDNSNFNDILEDVDSIYNDIEILKDKSNFEFAAGPNENENENFIGTIKVTYTIKLNYKNYEKKQDKWQWVSSTYNLESRMLEFSFTNNADFAKALKDFQNNVEKGFLKSGKSNINWEDIKGNKKDYEGYGNFLNVITKENKLEKLQEYKNGLLNFIKESNYFDKLNDFNFENDNSEFQFEDLNFDDNLINVFENKTAKTFVDLRENKKSSEDMFKVIFRNKHNEPKSFETLKNLYFTDSKLKIWNKEFIDLKNNYLKNNAFDEEEIGEVYNHNSYKFANSIGKIKVKGLKITFKKNNYIYKHILPDFELYTTYCVTNNFDEQQELLTNFTLNCLLKKFQEEFGIVDISNNNYPNFNSIDDYLFSVNKKYQEFLINNFSIINKQENELNYPYPGNFSQLFYVLNVNYNKFYKDDPEISGIIKNKEMNRYYFLYENYDKLFDYKRFGGTFTYNYEIFPKIDINNKEKGIILVPASRGAKDKNPNAITFKLGYLAVNIKYEKLFELGKKNEKTFIKFVNYNEKTNN